MQIAHVNDVFLRMITELVRRSVADATLDSTACHPHGKAFDMMIPACSPFALEHRSTPEFATPDDQSVFEQATLFEIGQESPGGTVGQATTNLHVVGQATMMIPSAVIQVNEAHPPLHQPASKKTIGSVATVTRFGSVELKCGRRFVRTAINPERRLHAKSHLVGGDSSVDLGVGPKGVFLAVQGGDRPNEGRRVFEATPAGLRTS